MKVGDRFRPTVNHRGLSYVQACLPTCRILQLSAHRDFTYVCAHGVGWTDHNTIPYPTYRDILKCC